ncbi:hypothetical protein V5799_003910, partial [Amblyomma americanum]
MSGGLWSLTLVVIWLSDADLSTRDHKLGILARQNSEGSAITQSRRGTPPVKDSTSERRP